MSRVKVLLIDDHILFREGLRLLLDRLEFDCELLEAGSCAQGFALLENCEDMDLVLLDLGLPDMCGMAALHVLRKRLADYRSGRSKVISHRDLMRRLASS